MKKKSLTILSSLLFLWGCTGGGGNQANNPTPAPTPPPTAQPQEATNQENPEENSDILVASNASPSTPSGLIAPTDADERLKQINQGRNDPFSVIPPPKAIINITPPAGATEGNNNVNGSGTTNGNTGRDNSTVASAGGANVGTNVSGSKNNNLPSACEISMLESSEFSIPEPSDAQAVLVSGIINVEGDDVAIVNTPDYDYSYRIRPGSYISNGLVYVKSINSYGRNPSVILEQYGQEVVRRVGEAPIEAKKEGSGETAAFQLPFKKEQLNIINNQVKGLKLVSVEEVRAVKRGDNSNSTQTNQVSQEIIEISGYVCNTTNKPISVNSISFDLNTANTDLPPLTAYFEEISQGDISQRVEVQRGARTIQPNRRTIFKGTVTNSRVFNTSEKIDMQLSNWK